MTRFHNPYHFAPHLAADAPTGVPRIAVADAQDEATHDRYVSSRFSGRIVCSLTPITPGVVGNRQTERDGGGTLVQPFEIDGRPAIFASSLRGMISAVYEASTNSAFRVLHNAPYTRRREMSESLSAIGMVVVTQDAEGRPVRKLRPLALPTLTEDNQNPFRVSAAQKRLFPRPLLKVFVRGYERVQTGNGTQLRVTAGSQIDRYQPQSHSADNREFWYLRMDLPRYEEDQIAGVGFYERETERSKFLLAQSVRDDTLIPASEYAGQPGYQRGILRILGIDGRESEVPPTKHYELFLPYPEDVENDPNWPLIDIEKAACQFEELADQRTASKREWSSPEATLPFHLRGSRRNPQGERADGEYLRLRDGDLVVFAGNTERVTEVAVSSIWRSPLKHAHEFFEREMRPFSSKRETVSPAELLFGFVSQDEAQPDEKQDESRLTSLAGRLRFSFAKAHGAGENGDAYYMNGRAPVALQILSSPKPPCPALYFRDRNGKGRYYEKKTCTSAMPQGRKFYLHRGNTALGTNPWATARDVEQLSASDLRQFTFCPLWKPDAFRFFFHVDFDNLTKDELEQLCYALDPTDQSWSDNHRFHHKIGLGKPLGLGTVRLDVETLSFVDRKKRYAGEYLFADSGDEPVAVRYSETWHRSPEGANDLPTRYRLPAAAFGALLADDDEFSFLKLRSAGFAQTPTPLRHALAILGSRSSTPHPVHYPQIDQADVTQNTPRFEEEYFKWFQANDRTERNDGGRQALEPLSDDPDRRSIPTLRRLPEV